MDLRSEVISHPWIQLLSIFVLFFTISVSSAQNQESISDIFFLDLGIVIEPSDGSESYSRVVARTSDEVKFRVKKNSKRVCVYGIVERNDENIR